MQLLSGSQLAGSLVYSRDTELRVSLSSEMMVRIRRAQWLILSMLILSLLLVVLGAYTTTRAESLNVSGYGSGVIVSFLTSINFNCQ